MGPDLRSDPAKLFALPSARRARDKRNMTVRVDVEDRAMWLKHFRPGGQVDRVMYGPGPGKAVYAWNAAMALMEQGFHTPRPLIGLRRAGRLGGAEGVVGFEDVPDHAPLAEWVAGGSTEAVDQAALMKALGACLRRFHGLGFRHRDLRRGNILAARTGGDWSFCFLDLNRLRIQKPLTEMQRLREVEKLNLSEESLESFFEAYMPDSNSKKLAAVYRRRVDYADRLERLPQGKLLRKAWYYSWELRTFSQARRP